MVEDLGEVKRSQREARQLAELFALTMESISDGFVTLDREWRVAYMNAASARMFQGERSAVLGNSFWDQFAFLKGTSIERELRRAAETKQAVQLSQFFAPCQRWLEMRAYPSEEGLAVYFCDVGPAKASALANARTWRPSSTLPEDAIITVDLGDWIQGWNASAQRIFGHSESEMLGQPLTTIIPPERWREHWEILAKVRRGERLSHFETMRRGKGGRDIGVSISVSPIQGRVRRGHRLLRR